MIAGGKNHRRGGDQSPHSLFPSPSLSLSSVFLLHQLYNDYRGGVEEWAHTEDEYHPHPSVSWFLALSQGVGTSLNHLAPPSSSHLPPPSFPSPPPRRAAEGRRAAAADGRRRAGGRRAPPTLRF